MENDLALINLPLVEQLREDSALLAKAGLGGRACENMTKAANLLAASTGRSWPHGAAEWHRQQALTWEGNPASTTSIPSATECEIMAEIHRYMAERIEGACKARELYERVLLFPNRRRATLPEKSPQE